MGGGWGVKRRDSHIWWLLLPGWWAGVVGDTGGGFRMEEWGEGGM